MKLFRGRWCLTMGLPPHLLKANVDLIIWSIKVLTLIQPSLRCKGNRILLLMSCLHRLICLIDCSLWEPNWCKHYGALSATPPTRLPTSHSEYSVNLAAEIVRWWLSRRSLPTTRQKTRARPSPCSFPITKTQSPSLWRRFVICKKFSSISYAHLC